MIEDSLLRIWKDRYLPYSEELLYYYDEDLSELEESNSFQPFLTFDGKRFRPNNFVGFIYSNQRLIEIYPKVFKHNGEEYKVEMVRHLHFWFKYCRKLTFPFLEAPLDNIDVENIPELFLYLFAKFTLNIVSTQPYSRYEEVSEEMIHPKGRIDFKATIADNYSNGYFHKLSCEYEPFIYNNKLNQAIKYVSRLLARRSSFIESQMLLQEIIYILDDVEDIPCRAQELEQLKINSLYSEYKLIIDWCIRFLNQQLFSPAGYDYLQWTLLLPMEYVFEDYIAGFIEKHFSDKYTVHKQKSDLYLSEQPVAFKMRHDILIVDKKSKKKIIIDTKYKLRAGIKPDDRKGGISNSDMYQMVSYAYRRGCEKVILLYPNVSEELREDRKYIIKSGFDDLKIISVFACEVPFWSILNFNTLEELLKLRFNNILETCSN